MMRDEQDAILDDLLARWHQYRPTARTARGFAPKSLVCGDYKTSRQYDDTNGALDDDLSDMRSRAVDFQVQQMADPHKTAIYMLARNLATGYEVWNSPRLPTGDALKIIVREARGMLIGRLVAAGVI